ncbi:uncharacterized protein LOC142349666 [Convolutriloba macropyga]|uniref:uncharacterized protein LOC142349666 n=1 Tax=Convolutriloba macropyga TaxID=536237 RepID=UPI003F51E76F
MRFYVVIGAIFSALCLPNIFGQDGRGCTRCFVGVSNDSVFTEFSPRVAVSVGVVGLTFLAVLIALTIFLLVKRCRVLSSDSEECLMSVSSLEPSKRGNSVEPKILLN